MTLVHRPEQESHMLTTRAGEADMGLRYLPTLLKGGNCHFLFPLATILVHCIKIQNFFLSDPLCNISLLAWELCHCESKNYKMKKRKCIGFLSTLYPERALYESCLILRQLSSSQRVPRTSPYLSLIASYLGSTSKDPYYGFPKAPSPKMRLH